jgi:hypothetical protein
MNFRKSEFWLNLLWAIAFLGIFYLVKIKTDFWAENHWVGFSIGATFGLVMLLRRRTFPKSSLTRTDSLRLGIVMLVAGILEIVRFFYGGGSDAGFIAFLFLTFGVQHVLTSRLAGELQTKHASPIVNNG